MNEKCKKMLSKSHERIVPARGISEDKLEVLKNMEDRAFNEIDELDNIIEGLVDRHNIAKNPQRVQSSKNVFAKQKQKEELNCYIQ